MNIKELFPPKLHAASFGEARQIALSLRARHFGGYWMARCPCHDDRTASLSIKEGEGGRLLMNCHSASACKFADIVNELTRLGHMGSNKLERARRLAPYVKPVPTEHTPDKRALWLWNNGVPCSGTLAQTYLERRGILIAPPSLRYFADPRAMIAGFQRPDGKLVAVQATFLTKEGEKVAGGPPKLTYGSMRDGAVRLAAAAPVLGLSEGTETGLSAMVMAGMPVWVSLGGKRLHDVVLPELVRVVHIFSDNDQPGRDAAQRAADVHLQAGRCVELHSPPAGVNDYNDLLMAHADCDGDDDRLMVHLQVFGETVPMVGRAAA